MPTEETEVSESLNIEAGEQDAALEVKETETKETEEEETEQETETESQEEDSEATEQVEGEEEALEFDDWRKQFDGMPDSIKSEDDLAASYVAMLPEMKRAQTGHQKLQQLDAALKSRGLTGGVNDLLSGDIPQFSQPAPAVQQPPEGESYFNSNPVGTVVADMIKDGRIRNSETQPENEATHKWFAQVMDQAIGPQFRKAEEVYTVAMRGLKALTDKVRNLEWAGLNEGVRGSLNRTEVDALLDRGLFDTYDEAIRFHAFNKPDLLSQLTSEAQRKGREQGRKKLKRSKALRRDKSVSKSRSYDYDKYIGIGGDWDQDAMAGLSSDQRIEMLEAYQREHK